MPAKENRKGVAKRLGKEAWYQKRQGKKEFKERAVPCVHCSHVRAARFPVD